MSKSLFKSKTFYFNLLTFGLGYAGYLPAEYAGAVAAIGNIVLRLLTDQPVHVVPAA